MLRNLFLLFLSFVSLSVFAAEEYNGRISGKVLTRDGKPAGWVTIQIENSQLTTITDEDGNFTFKNIKPGTYLLKVTYSGMESGTQQVEVTDDAVANATFVLSQSAKKLQEVVIDGRKSANIQPVSVGKLPVAPIDLPQSFSIVDQSVMRYQQAQKLSDAIKNVNGVYLSATRAGTQESFSARGYRLSGDNFFKNGARINAGVFPEMSSLEKVEVLKGGAAILYGEVAPGGIINMVTKQPKFNFGGEVSVRAGSYDLYKPAIDIYGPVSKKVAYRINGTYEDAGSFRNQVHSKKYYINPSLLFNLNEKTSLLLQADYLDNHFTPDFGLGSLDNTNIADLPRSMFHGTSWQYNKVKQTTASATLKHKFSKNWNLNASGSYQGYNRDYYSTERIQAKANGDWARPLNKILSKENSFYGQATITGKVKTGNVDHVILTGVDADYYLTSSDKFDNPAIYDTINILDASRYVRRTDIPQANGVSRTETPVTRLGAYVQDLISISNKVKLLAGVRWSQQIAGEAETTYFGKDSLVTGAGKTDHAFSPRLGVVYKAFSNTAFFASYSNSFSANSGTDVYGNALDASVIDQYEVGIKNDFLNGALSVNLTAYRILNNNLAQTAAFEKDGITPNNNKAFKELVGQTTSDGVELDIAGHPLKGLDVIAGYSYNNMTYSKTPDTEGSYVEGERLVGTPQHTANASVFYNFDNMLKGLKLGASVFYTGDRFAGWNNTKGQAQSYSRLIPVAGFTTLDLSAGYTCGKISLIAKVSNVTNTFNYYVHENYSINPIPPVSLIGTLSYRF